eukprot:451026-Rhodomonas_salina.1
MRVQSVLHDGADVEEGLKYILRGVVLCMPKSNTSLEPSFSTIRARNALLSSSSSHYHLSVSVSVSLSNLPDDSPSLTSLITLSRTTLQISTVTPLRKLSAVLSHAGDILYTAFQDDIPILNNPSIPPHLRSW